jgi:rhamnulokinase
MAIEALGTFAAVDLGASSGRVMVARVAPDRLDLQEAHRFPNRPVRTAGTLHWDVLGLYAGVLDGLRAAGRDAGRIDGIGIDSWAVDYGLLDADGDLLGNPVHYRDARHETAVPAVHAAVPPAELYRLTGLQHLPFNTIFQLAAARDTAQLAAARTLLLVPDLLAHWLTGAVGAEVTNASTTGLLDAHTHQWSTPILDRLGIDPGLLPALDHPGDVRGHTDDGTPMVTVGSHDTASAVVGVPATSNHFAYIASGTWSLVGLELDHPVLTDAARHTNFTNEHGVDQRTRFLRNVGGLWPLQECLREWGRNDLDTLLRDAEALPPGGPRIDIDDDTFIPPGDMPTRIASHAGRALNHAETVRCILDSLADAYARTIDQASTLADHRVEIIHVVGGGSQNRLLCQLTADAAGLPVLAGPVEATALGNVAVQARAAGLLPDSLDDIRTRLAATIPVTRYEPR